MVALLVGKVNRGGAVGRAFAYSRGARLTVWALTRLKLQRRWLQPLSLMTPV